MKNIAFLLMLLCPFFHGFIFAQNETGADSIIAITTRLAKNGKWTEANNILLENKTISLQNGDYEAYSRFTRKQASLLNKQGEYNKALFVLKDAVRRCQQDKDVPLSPVLKLFIQISNEYNQSALADSAVIACDEGLAFYKQSRKPPVKELGFLLGSLSNIYYSQGDYSRSLDYILQEIRVLKKTDANDYDVSVAHYNTANSYWGMGQLDSAAAYYQMVLPVWQNRFGTYHANVALVNNNLGGIFWEMGENEKAVAYFNRAALIELKNNPEQYYAPDSLSDKAMRNLENNAYDNAIAYFNLALDARIRDLGLDNPYTIGCYNFIARAYNQKGDIDLALRNYQTAIRLLTDGFDNTDVYSNPANTNKTISDHFLLESLMAKTELLYERYNTEGKQVKDLETAFQTIGITLPLINKIRNRAKNEASKQFWTDEIFPFFEKAMKVAFTLYHFDKADVYFDLGFRISEMNKAFLLQLSIQDMDAKKISGIPDSIQVKENQLKNKKAELEQLILYEQKKCSMASEAKITSFRQLIFDLEHEYDQLISEIERDYPKYFQLKYDNHIPSISELQSSLQQGLLISYFTGQEIIYCQIISSREKEWVRTGLPAGKIRDLVLQFRTLTGNPQTYLKKPAETLNRFKDIGTKLYRQLLPTLQSGKYGDVSKLMIIPDGVLHYLPFGILLTQENNPQGRDFRELPYLIRNYRIGYNYSASLSILPETRQPAVHMKYAGFAPGYDALAGNVNAEVEINTINPLKYNRVEIEKGLAIFDGKGFSGDESTIANFEEYGSKAAIVHLAMHAIVSYKYPLYSQLIFSAGDGRSFPGLKTYQLYNMQLNARLAILSACNTGMGHIQKGEGIISLSRAFRYAGCPAIIMSLWTANDESVARITGGFLDYISKKEDKDKALQQAKLDYLHQADPLMAHPYFWAGLTLIGDTAPLQFTTATNITLLVIIIITTLLIFGLIVMAGMQLPNRH
jgi:CHAT domain-containing protein